MPFEIPADLDPAALPLAFLIGDWAGVGLGQYSTIKDFRFGQVIAKTERGYYMGGTISGGTSSHFFAVSFEGCA